MSKISLSLILLFLILVLLSLVIGPASYFLFKQNLHTFWEVIKILRLPRTLLALLTGGALGLTGAVLQGFLRNPLADAGIIGISSAASFGAILALALGVNAIFTPFISILSTLFLTIFLYQWIKKNPEPLTFILLGLALNSLFNALAALTLNFSNNPYKNLEIMFWLLGSFSQHPLLPVVLTIPLVLSGGILLWSSRRTLDALSLGEEMALSLGFSLKEAHQRLILGTALCIGPLVALGGVVSFVGLIAPHITRTFTRGLPSQNLIPATLVGSLLCLTADIGVRLLSWGIEIKVGVLTSLLGAPFFLYLILKKPRISYDSF